ncbi:MAG TPA: VCBS repeat-containing protein, partial [bacterium]
MTRSIFFAQLVFFLSTPPVFSQTAFAEMSISLPLTNVDYSAVSWGDYDGDGDPDILLTGQIDDFTPVSKVYENVGPVQGNPEGWIFVDVDANLDPVAGGSATWVDFDNDGDLDINLSGCSNCSGNKDFILKLYKNEEGRFAEVGISPPFMGAQNPRTVWGDYDNDGDCDVLVTTSSSTEIYENQKGSLVRDEIASASLMALNSSNTYVAAEWGDYDNDGDLDILMTGGNFISKIFRNDSRTFSDIQFEFQASSLRPEVEGVILGALAWGDYDGNGWLDFLLAGEAQRSDPGDPPNDVAILFQNLASPDPFIQGGWSFSKVNIDLNPVAEGRSAWGDYDNDGYLDLLLVGNDRREGPFPGRPVASLYRNNRNNGFTEDIHAGLTGVLFGSAAWGDFDNDGDLDILSAGSYYIDFEKVRVTTIYRNHSAKINSPPNAPTGLSSSVAGRTVTFSWERAVDIETPQNGVTYNLRVGTEPGGIDVVSPMAGSSGARNISKIGNVQLNTAWNIKALKEGIYFWSVQTVDNAFTASPFAEEKGVVIGNPTIDHTAIQTAAAGQGLTIEAVISDTIDSGVRRAVLNYREGGASSFTQVEMSIINNTYRATIPGDQVDSQGLEYFILAEDSLLTTRMPETGGFPVQVSVQSLQKDSPQPGGSAQKAYRLFSVPVNLLEKDPFTNLEDDLGPFSRPAWRIFEFLPSQRISESPSELQAGRAYWLIVKDDGKIIDFSAGNTFRTDTEFAIPLYLGWTLIGNPFNFDIPMGNLRLASEQALDLRMYNGAWQDATGPLRPFEGYAVANDSAFIDTLYVNPIIGAAAGHSSKVERDVWLWSLSILAECQEARDADNFAAVVGDAAQSLDVYDRPEPPVIGEYVSLYFPHNDWSTNFDKFSTDARPQPVDGEVWELTIRSKVRDKVRLTFSGMDDVPNEFEIWISDPELGVSHDLRAAKLYFVA